MFVRVAIRVAAMATHPTVVRQFGTKEKLLALLRETQFRLRAQRDGRDIHLITDRDHGNRVVQLICDKVTAAVARRQEVAGESTYRCSLEVTVAMRTPGYLVHARKGDCHVSLRDDRDCSRIGGTVTRFSQLHHDAAAEAVDGRVTHQEVVARISPRLYGRAATMLGTDAVREIARRIDASIERAAGLEGDLVAPDIEMEVQSDSRIEPDRFSISERDPPSEDFAEAMRRFSESNKNFEERQRRNYDTFVAFRTNLTKAL